MDPFHNRYLPAHLVDKIARQCDDAETQLNWLKATRSRVKESANRSLGQAIRDCGVKDFYEKVTRHKDALTPNPSAWLGKSALTAGSYLASRHDQVNMFLNSNVVMGWVFKIPRKTSWPRFLLKVALGDASNRCSSYLFKRGVQKFYESQGRAAASARMASDAILPLPDRAVLLLTTCRQNIEAGVLVGAALGLNLAYIGLWLSETVQMVAAGPPYTFFLVILCVLHSFSWEFPKIQPVNVNVNDSWKAGYLAAADEVKTAALNAAPDSLPEPTVNSSRRA